MRVPVTLAVFVLAGMISHGLAIKCWKCIAHDCAYDPEENYKASKEDCHEGQQCMKVRYQMFDNITYYDSVIRTCTAGPCEMTSQNEFKQCIATPKLYMISGCSLRTCCADRDLCNTASAVEYSLKAVLFVMFVSTVLTRIS